MKVGRVAIITRGRKCNHAHPTQSLLTLEQVRQARRCVCNHPHHVQLWKEVDCGYNRISAHIVRGGYLATTIQPGSISEDVESELRFAHVRLLDYN